MACVNHKVSVLIWGMANDDMSIFQCLLGAVTSTVNSTFLSEGGFWSICAIHNIEFIYTYDTIIY
jgi:multisubunit Na+/H+ antiporter MnhE subunit